MGSLTAPALAINIGIPITGATAGSVLFAGAAGILAQDNANFFWDDANNRLGIGTAAPTSPLHITTTTNINPLVQLATSSNTASNFGTIAWNCTFGNNYPISAASILAAIGAAGASPYLAFNTSNTTLAAGVISERARITNTGALLIGTTVETAGAGLIQLSTAALATTAAFGIVAGTDTNLYRSAANTWTTDNAFFAKSLTATDSILVSAGGYYMRANAAIGYMFGVADDANLSRIAAGLVGLGNGSVQGNFSGRLKLTSVIHAAVTVAALNGAPTVGEIQAVNNALAPAVGALVAGGGAANALVWWNGAQWTVIGI